MSKNTRTIHFVYTVPSGGRIRRIIDKVLQIIYLPPLYRYGIDILIPWREPVRAPHSISRKILHELQKHGRVRFYSIFEKGCIKLTPEDIFIGEPIPDKGFVSGTRPTVDDHASITSRTLRENPNNHHKFLITPFSSDPRYIVFAQDLAEHYADKVILVATGDIWTRDWKSTPFGTIDLKNVLRLDNAINPTEYPQVKKKFNPKGHRKFLYIGHTEWYKNTVELERIAATMPGFVGGHIGGGHIKGWKKIVDFARLTPEFMSRIGQEYDIFINTSSGDPQATTILEAICFGFPVACTRETGYDTPSIMQLDTTDTHKNVEVLTRIQQMEESELKKFVSESQTYIREKHDWKTFLDKTMVFIGLR